jgi:outer membrane protein TolC
VQSAKAAAVAASRATTLDRFLWMPTVAGIAKENYNSNAGFANRNYTYDLMVNVSVPLYDRGTRYAQLREDQAKLAQAQAQLATKAQVQVSASYRAGVATSLDLSDVEQKKFAAASAAAQARAALEIRKAEIAAAEGRLYLVAAR